MCTREPARVLCTSRADMLCGPRRRMWSCRCAQVHAWPGLARHRAPACVCVLSERAGRLRTLLLIHRWLAQCRLAFTPLRV